MIVQEFIDELSRRLRDVNKKQWDNDFLISATNAALGALTTVMPQSFTVNRDLTLAAGVEQTIDPDLHRIVTLLHNMSPVDNTPRRAITKADMSVLDASCPHWRQDPPRKYVRHWMSDEFDESTFYVWPPAPAEPQLSIRGTFTQTPYVDGTPPPVVPDEPAVPVDPGVVGTGANTPNRGPYVADALAPNIVYMTNPDVSYPTSVTGDTVDLVLPDVSALSGQVEVDEAMRSKTGAGVPDTKVLMESGVPVDWSDPRMVSGAVLSIYYGSTAELLGINLYDGGTTLADIENYQQALAVRQEYEDAIAALAAFNADTTVIRADDELPVKRAHIPALQEFAMYYAYSVDDDLTPNSGRAQRHWLAFFQMLNKREDANLMIGNSAEITE